MKLKLELEMMGILRRISRLEESVKRIENFTENRAYYLVFGNAICRFQADNPNPTSCPTTPVSHSCSLSASLQCNRGPVRNFKFLNFHNSGGWQKQYNEMAHIHTKIIDENHFSVFVKLFVFSSEKKANNHIQGLSHPISLPSQPNRREHHPSG